MAPARASSRTPVSSCHGAGPWVSATRGPERLRRQLARPAPARGLRQARGEVTSMRSTTRPRDGGAGMDAPPPARTEIAVARRLMEHGFLDAAIRLFVRH